jgi:hypothetical protein
MIVVSDADIAAAAVVVDIYCAAVRVGMGVGICADQLAVRMMDDVGRREGCQ